MSELPSHPTHEEIIEFAMADFDVKYAAGTQEHDTTGVPDDVVATLDRSIRTAYERGVSTGARIVGLRAVSIITTTTLECGDAHEALVSLARMTESKE